MTSSQPLLKKLYYFMNNIHVLFSKFFTKSHREIARQAKEKWFFFFFLTFKGIHLMTQFKPKECRCYISWWQSCIFMGSVSWSYKTRNMWSRIALRFLSSMENNTENSFTPFAFAFFLMKFLSSHAFSWEGWGMIDTVSKMSSDIEVILMTMDPIFSLNLGVLLSTIHIMIVRILPKHAELSDSLFYFEFLS